MVKNDDNDNTDDQALDPRPLDEQLLEKLYRREVLDEVETLLEKGDVARATELLRELREEFPRDDGGPELFDALLETSPLREGFHYEARARVYHDARLLKDARGDLVRGMLVAPRTEAHRLLEAFTGLGTVAVAGWVGLAASAVVARLRGNAKREKQLLLQAIRKAPDELALFAALAVNQLGSCSDVELFALRQCVRVAPGWQFARLELQRAARAIGDDDAARIEPRPVPTAGSPPVRSSRGRIVA